jgi:ABC-type transporter Mla subunit MlaD
MVYVNLNEAKCKELERRLRNQIETLIRQNKEALDTNNAHAETIRGLVCSNALLMKDNANGQNQLSETIEKMRKGLDIGLNTAL